MRVLFFLLLVVQGVFAAPIEFREISFWLRMGESEQPMMQQIASRKLARRAELPGDPFEFALERGGLRIFQHGGEQRNRRAQSAQRHWHHAEDEFVYVVEGELVLCEDGGETVLRPGDAAGFKAGVANGHCLVNRTSQDAVYLEVGTRSPRDQAEYPDIDLSFRKDEGGQHFTHKSGEPYPKG